MKFKWKGRRVKELEEKVKWMEEALERRQEMIWNLLIKEEERIQNDFKRIHSI